MLYGEMYFVLHDTWDKLNESHNSNEIKFRLYTLNKQLYDS